MQIKPDITIVGDRLAVFMGTEYKLMPIETADAFGRRYQSELAKLRRQVKSAKRKARKVPA